MCQRKSSIAYSRSIRRRVKAPRPCIRQCKRTAPGEMLERHLFVHFRCRQLNHGQVIHLNLRKVSPQGVLHRNIILCSIARTSITHRIIEIKPVLRGYSAKLTRSKIWRTSERAAESTVTSIIHPPKLIAHWLEIPLHLKSKTLRQPYQIETWIRSLLQIDSLRTRGFKEEEIRINRDYRCRLRRLIVCKAQNIKCPS